MGIEKLLTHHIVLYETYAMIVATFCLFLVETFFSAVNVAKKHLPRVQNVRHIIQRTSKWKPSELCILRLVAFFDLFFSFHQRIPLKLFHTF